MCQHPCVYPSHRHTPSIPGELQGPHSMCHVSKSPTQKHPSLLFKFAKICMVGVKEKKKKKKTIVNCTILLTPKSNFFCLVYLDFSVCFVVKQPTRVVVHKTAFESWEHSHPWRTDCACLRLVHDLKIEYRWWNLGSVNNKVVCIVLFFFALET